jgi:hypothetical protein
MPGRHGDILWSLPSVRAISESLGEPVDLALSARYGALQALLERQPYIHEVIVVAGWDVQETAPMTPRTPPADWLRVCTRPDEWVVHLGYEGWPDPNLPLDIWHRALAQLHANAVPADAIRSADLSRPWITPPYPIMPTDLTIGFTDEHFELKTGLAQLLINRYTLDGAQQVVNVSHSPRWNTEGKWSVVNADWETAAAWIAQSRCFVGCCSALQVLAIACGTPAVVVEPAAARLQAVFWPLGFDGDRVQVVRGNDGLPTVDARHTAEAIAAVWARAKAPSRGTPPAIGV